MPLPEMNQRLPSIHLSADWYSSTKENSFHKWNRSPIMYLLKQALQEHIIRHILYSMVSKIFAE